MANDNSKLGGEKSYHEAMERLVLGDQKNYAISATSRKDYPNLSLQNGPSYSADKHEIFVESSGPEGGPYVLVLDLSEKRAFHAYGTYENQKGRGIVEDITFPPG